MRKSTLIAVTITSFLTPFTLSSINVALPSIAIEFSANTSEMNLIATGFLISSAIFLIPFGRLADMYGRRKLFLFGTLVFSLFNFLSAFTSSSVQLIVLRLFQGIGSAMIFSTGIAILILVYPLKERGKVLGINTASVYLGLTLGPFAGGILTKYLGWRSIFMLISIFGAFALAISVRRIKNDIHRKLEEKFDHVGSILYGLSIVAFTTASTERSYFYFLPLSALLLFAFLWWENRQKYPVLDLSLFTSNRTFAFSNISALINYSATFALVYLMSIYLQLIKGFDPQTAGMILVSQPAIMASLSPVAGLISDRIEPKYVSSIGMMLNAFALILFSTLTENSPIYEIISYLLLMGLGFAFFSSPNVNAAMSSIGKEKYGIGSATISTMRVLGQTLSMVGVMLVFSIFIGNVQVRSVEPDQLMTAMKFSFKMFSAICWIGVVFSLARGNVR